MKTIKKIVAMLSSLALFLSFVYSVEASGYTEIEAANALASRDIINDRSNNTSEYRVSDTISRREVLKIMMRLKGDLDETSIDFESEGDCSGNRFDDLPNLGSNTDWACYYAEPAVDSGMISSNDRFNPNHRVTKAEALKFIMKGRGIEPDNDSWEGYISAAIREGVLDSSFSDYNTKAERGWIFVLAANAVDATSDETIYECDICEIMCTLDEDSCDECSDICE